MTTRVDGSLLHLNINWAPTQAAIDKKDDFVVLSNPNTSTKTKTTSRLEQQDQEEFIVKITTTNAAFAEPEEGILTRWVSSVWFPPTYRIAREQIVTMQRTNIDRGLIHPTTVEDLPLLILDRTQPLSINFSVTYLANSKAKAIHHSAKSVAINPSLFKSHPHIQVTLEKRAFQSDHPIYFHCYDHPPTLEEQVVTTLAQGSSAVVRSTSAAAETLIETVGDALDEVRESYSLENCSIS